MGRDSRGRGLLIAGGVLVATVLTLVLGARWLDWVVVSQSGPVQSLPVPDIRSDYLTGVLWAALLGAGVLLWGRVVRFQGPLIVVWIAKALVALGPMLFYDYTYGVDPDGYFLNASTPGFDWQGLQIGQGTQNTQMLAWLHFRWLSTSFNATRLSFAFVGLVGVYLVYRAGTICTGRDDRRLFFAFALMPSVLFWSSILGKDSIAFFGIAAYTYGVVAWHTLGRTRYLVWVVLGLTVVVYVRMWFGPILLIPLAVLGWTRTKGLTKGMAFVGLGLVGVLASPIVLQEAIGVDLWQQGELLQATDSMSRGLPIGGSSREVPDLATPGEIARFAPLGVLTALFRPLPGEVSNVFGMFTGLENAFLVFLALRAVWRTKARELKQPLVVWAISAVLIWAGVYSVASFQNLGTMSRYKLQIMPLFLGLLFYLGRRRDRLLVPLTWTAISGRRHVAIRRGI